MTKLFYFLIPCFLFQFFYADNSNALFLNNNNTNIIKLTKDGSWGYAGRHACITHGKLFFSYLDTSGNSWLGSYDQNSGKLKSNNIWQGNSNLHSSNPFVVRKDGRIQVFVDKGAYFDNKIRWKTSTKPWSIESFGKVQSSTLEADIIQGRQFYPMVHQPTGNMYLVLNARRDAELRETVMWVSRDGGDTWTEYYNLWGLGKGLKGNRSYTRTFIKNDEIHFVTLRVGWNETLAGHEIGMVEGIYYIKFDIKSQMFYHSNGQPAFTLNETPVYETKYFDNVWNYKTDGNNMQRALWSDIVADTDGIPYITFVVQDAVPNGQSAFHDGYWATTDRQGKWYFNKVTRLAKGWDNNPERKNYSIALDPQNPLIIFASKSTSQDGELSSVHRFESSDNGKTWHSRAVLSNVGRITTVVVPHCLDQSSKLINVLWLDGKMEGWLEFSTQIKAYKQLDK